MYISFYCLVLIFKPFTNFYIEEILTTVLFFNLLNLTKPSSSAYKVKSRPMPMFLPGLIDSPRCLIIIEPFVTLWS